MSVFCPHLIKFFCGHCSAICDLENDTGKISGYWGKIDCDLTLLGLVCLVFSMTCPSVPLNEGIIGY